MRGSILNYRTFFMNEPSSVNIRASKNTVILEINFASLAQFTKDSELFERKLLSHQMKILNQGMTFPLDYMRSIHEDYMTPLEAGTLPEIAERDTLFKQLVMRKVIETRIEKAKPKLGMLLKGLKGGLRQRMETRQKLLDLYECDEEERDILEKEKRAELKGYMEEGDSVDKNTLYIELKLRLKKAQADLREQEEILESMSHKLEDALGADGLFLK
jgi:hypothetical protein